jgi:hypothetical protein
MTLTLVNISVKFELKKRKLYIFFGVLDIA